MLKRIELTVGLAMALGLLAQSASAAVLQDDFDDGTLAGWPSPNVGGTTLSNPGSGGNPNGYLQGARETGNTSYYLSENYTGDWGAMVAPELILSADLRIESTGSMGTLRLEISNPTFSDIWRKDVFTGPLFPWDASNGWRHVEYPINVNWTDAEANAEGWTRVFPSGSPKSFAEVLADVKGNLTGFTLAQASNFDPVTLSGLDNFRLAPIPEPAGITLFLTGAVLVMTLGVKRLVRHRV